MARDATRRRALEAMADAVGERGYADTTVSDVLQRARMSRRTFYELFDNREACFLAAYDEGRRETLARIEHAPAAHAPWPEHMTAVLQSVLDHFAESPGFARLLVVEPASVGQPGLQRHESTMRELSDRLAVSHPAAAQLAPDELRLRCEASVGALHRVVHARIAAGRVRELPELAPQLAGLVRELAPVA
jgi:AcrR family transcriptional regulator